MALVVKTKSLKCLRDYGCDADLISALEAFGAQIEAGKFPGKVILHRGKNTWNLVNDTGLVVKPNEVDSFLTTVLFDIKKAVSAELGGGSAKAAAPKPVDMVIPLRDANAMYQRVIGTSSGSVYVLVAISSKAGVKIAAKMESPLQISIRAEPDASGFKPETVKALEGQGLVLKDAKLFKYMSRHFTCDLNAPPSKVLGAVLMGSGIEFDTPLPKIEEVAKGGA